MFLQIENKEMKQKVIQKFFTNQCNQNLGCG